MKAKKPLVSALLTLMTLGFYGIYWFKQAKPLLQQKDQEVPSSWLLFLSLLLLPLLVIADLTLQTRFVEHAANIQKISYLAIMAVGLLFIASYCLWSRRYNLSLNQATAGMVSSPLVILPLGLGFAGFAKLQMGLNGYLSMNVTTPQPPAQAQDDSPQMTATPMAPVATTGSSWQQGIATIAPTVASPEANMSPAPATAQPAPSPAPVPQPAPPTAQVPQAVQPTIIAPTQPKQ